jgi:hypothetical protein
VEAKRERLMPFDTNPLDNILFNRPSVYPGIDNAGSANEFARADHTHSSNTSIPEPLNINGSMLVSQRGNGPFTVFGYDIDGWLGTTNGIAKNVSRVALPTGSIPEIPIGFYRRTVTSSVVGAGNFSVAATRILDVGRLAGKTISVSWYARSTVAGKKLNVGVEQSFGSGGSAFVSTVVKTTLLTTDWVLYTATLKVPGIGGKIIGAGNYTQIIFWFDAGSSFNARSGSIGHQSSTIDLTGVVVNYGSVNRTFQVDATSLLVECRKTLIVVNKSFAWHGNMFSGTGALIRYDYSPMVSTPTVIIPAGPYTNWMDEVGIVPRTPTLFNPYYYCPEYCMLTVDVVGAFPNPVLMNGNSQSFIITAEIP